jgi:hypothetical protein
MLTKIDFENDLIKLLKPKIGFCPINGKYHLNEKWVNQIGLDYFDEPNNDFEINLLRNITNFKNPRAIIQEFCETIWTKIEWYEKNNINNFSFLDSIKKSIKPIEIKEEPYIEDDYTFESVSNFDFENEYEDGYLFDVLDDIYRNFGGTKDASMLEEAKLVNAMQLHHESLIIFYHSLYKIEMGWEELNLENYTSINYNRKNNPSGLKCNIDLLKIEVAVLFRFLNDSGLFYIDEIDKEKNRVNLYHFFEENFNYTDKDEKNYPITRLNNDLSKITNDNRLPIQLYTLEMIENKIRNYRLKIEKKYSRNR